MDTVGLLHHHQDLCELSYFINNHYYKDLINSLTSKWDEVSLERNRTLVLTNVIRVRGKYLPSPFDTVLHTYPSSL